MKPISTAFFLLVCIVSLGSTTAHSHDLKLTETEQTIHITQRGKPVLNFVKVTRPVPKGLESHYSRSGYIHPVFSPTGQEVSGDYPLDHAHQHALFFAWTKATFQGKTIDFWNQFKQQANVEFREVLHTQQEENQIRFSVKLAYVVGAGEEQVDAIYESWTVTVYQTPDEYFLFDLTSVQSCASDKPLIVEQNHYGGMAFRGHSQWLKTSDDQDTKPTGFQFLTSEGKNRIDGNHTQPNWVAMTGPIDGQQVSLTAFCSPHNFRSPQHVRLHPTKPYFCFAPMVDGAFEIKPGQKYTSNYRFLVTSEAVNPEQNHKQWQQYVHTHKQ